MKGEKSSYDIIWTEYPFEHLEGRGVIITDEHLYEIYSQLLEGFDVIVIKPGEGSKSMRMAEILIDQILEKKLSRGDYIAAFGGGVVGDLAGFVASIYKRGCRYYQIPTSLIAMVDSSVGGKTGVNHSNYKNIVGAFYSPEKVMINLKFLETLPAEEWLNGSGEVLKYAILDTDVYNLLMLGDSIDWSRLIKGCLEVKKRYVEADFLDHGLRQHLNLGHTFGHAIELYDGTSHGIAVAYGIKMIINVHHIENLEKTFEMLCRRLGIKLTREYDIEVLMSYVTQDKKNQGDRLVFVIPKCIGKLKIVEVKNEI